MIKIVADSGCDIREMNDLPAGIEYSRVPLKILVGDNEFTDDAALDIKAMMDTMYAYSGKTGTACSGSDEWEKQFLDADEVYVITITGSLSGSFNSAVLARDTVLESHPEKRIFVLDSLTAGPEIELLVRYTAKLAAQGKGFDEICELLTSYSKRTELLFMLERLDNFVKNGRVSKVAGAAVALLGIKVIGCASVDGKLELLHKSRGAQKSNAVILKEMQQRGYKGGSAVIGHSDNEKCARQLAGLILEAYPNADIQILPMSGLCCYYAEKQGVLIGYETEG